jgi:hypothetical protein
MSDVVATQDALSALKSPDNIERPYINMSEMISYLIMLSLFVVIITTNQSIFQDLNGNAGPGIKNNNTTIQVLCGFGILFCLIRICWANAFIKHERGSHIMELIFGLLVWGLFITVLVMSLTTKNQLKPENMLSSSSPVSIAVLANAKKHIETQVTLCWIGIGLSTLYTIFNIYSLIAFK